MKVKELIEKLQQCDPELEVLTYGHSLGYYHEFVHVHTEPRLGRDGSRHETVVIAEINN